MKVLHIIDSLGYGGAERLVVDLMPRLRDRGVAPVVVSLTNRMPLAQSLTDLAIPVVSLDFEGGIYSLAKLWRAGQTFHRLVRQEGAAIVHSHLYHSDVVSRLFTPARRPLVSTLHSQDSWWYQPGRLKSVAKTRLDRLLLALRNVRTIAVSESVGAQAKSPLAIKERDMRVICNGIDLRKFADTRRARALKTIIQVGRFYPQKGHRTSLLAFADLRNDYPDLRLVFVGSGPLENELRREASRLDIARSVEFKGARNDVPELLQQADIFWMPSKWEGLGIACMEAMASGLPVVASRVGGIPEIVVDGESGLLFDPGSPDQLAEATRRLLENSDLANAVSVHGRDRVERLFSIETTADHYVAAYHDILNLRW